MSRRAVAAAILVLGGCAGPSLPLAPPDPRLRALVEQPVGDFLADARIASLLAAGCDDIAMPQALFNALVVAREAGRGGLPFDPRIAARAADAAFRTRVADLRSRYPGDPFRGRSCAVIAEETARGAPATGFLARVAQPLPQS